MIFTAASLVLCLYFVCLVCFHHSKPAQVVSSCCDSAAFKFRRWLIHAQRCQRARRCLLRGTSESRCSCAAWRNLTHLFHPPVSGALIFDLFCYRLTSRLISLLQPLDKTNAVWGRLKTEFQYHTKERHYGIFIVASSFEFDLTLCTSQALVVCPGFLYCK